MGSPNDAVLAGLWEGIEKVAGDLPGRLGVMIHYLESGREVQWNADDLFPTASVIKVPIMVAVFEQVDRGTVQLEERLELIADEVSVGSGILQFLHLGLELTVEDAVELMIDISDNTATNLLIRRLTVDAINTTMSDLGLRNTRSAGPIGRSYPRHQQPKPSQTTPREMVTLLSLMARRQLVSEGASDQMLRILQHQMYEEMLPRYLPIMADPTETDCPTITVMHKTGAQVGIRADAGIIRTQGPGGVQHAIVAAFTADVDDDDLWTVENVAVTAVARIGKLAYDGLVAQAGDISVASGAQATR